MESFAKKKILRETRSFHLKKWAPLKGMASTKKNGFYY